MEPTTSASLEPHRPAGVVVQRGCRSTREKPSAADILEVLPGLEPDCSSRRDANLLTRSGVPADPTLAGLDLENAEPAELDSLATLHRQPHRVEHGVHRHLGLDLGDVGDSRHLVDDVNLDHA